MKHQWQVRRTAVAVANGQQRWDHAYQLLVRWATTSPPEQGRPVPPMPIWAQDVQEVSHACSRLCARLDDPSGAAADD
jgi:hypothetical protein